MNYPLKRNGGRDNMATIKQIKAVEKIIENHGNVSKAMKEVGYKENTAKNPKNLTESDGFKELIEKIGLTDTFLTKALVEDIKKKKQNRKPEIELGFKIRGRLSDKLDLTTGGKPFPLLGGASIKNGNNNNSNNETPEPNEQD